MGRIGSSARPAVRRVREVTKAQLRIRAVRQLKKQKEEDRRRKSEAIRRKVCRLTAFRRAKTVCCYVALPHEVQTWQLIEEMLTKGKQVVVPRVRPRTKRLQLCRLRDPRTELAPGAFGVWEPAAPRGRVRLRDLDMVLVPGLAFDRQGHRLGHGHGYFDRLLDRLPKTTATVGLAFRFQLLDRLPVDPHDRAVRTVLTA